MLKSNLHNQDKKLFFINNFLIKNSSKVVLYEYDTEKEVEYQLVSAEESDISKGLISITSPIGRSLVGKMEGDSVEIVTPSGTKDYEMRSLRTVHDMEDS